jgi:hypothetical protein
VGNVNKDDYTNELVETFTPLQALRNLPLGNKQTPNGRRRRRRKKKAISF